MKHPYTGETMYEVIPELQAEAIKNTKLTLLFFLINGKVTMWATESDHAKHL